MIRNLEVERVSTFQDQSSAFPHKKITYSESLNQKASFSNNSASSNIRDTNTGFGSQSKGANPLTQSTQKFKLFSLTEDGIVREISSQSSLGSSDPSPMKDSQEAGGQNDEFKARFAHLVCYDEQNVARSMEARAANQQARFTQSTMSQNEDERAERIQIFQLQLKEMMTSAK